MDINSEKLKLIEAILHLEDENTLARIKEIINEDDIGQIYLLNSSITSANEPEAEYLNAFWASLTPEQRAELEADIEEGERDIEAGNVFPHEEVWKEFEKWETKKK